MPNNCSLTEYSSVSKSYGDEMVSSENWVETSAATVNISEGNHEVKTHEPQHNMVSSENWVEISSAATVNIRSEGNHEVKSHEPHLNMTFPGEEEAQQHYKEYAKIVGFKVRRGKGTRLSDGSLKKKTFLCSNEGKRSDKPPPRMTKYTRKETRTGCKAMIQFSIENGKWVICQFISEHNHELQYSTQKLDIDSCSKIPEADSLIQPIHEIETVREAEAGACARFSNMNYSKHLPTKKMNSLQPEDAQGLLDCFKKLNAEDPSLFYTLQVDAESRITNFFWSNGTSKIDYDYFRDNLILDTTFRTTDRYNMICAPFWGLNHHRQQVLFGCAFLLDESLESFAWLLETFMVAMGRRQPKTIFTTECPEISEAVEAILPKSHHRLCKQLVFRNAKKHLAMYYEQPEFESLFHSCLFDCQSDSEFHSIWNSLLEQYNLYENPWLQNIYTLHTKRSYLFSKVICCAGIHSNQGSENFSHADVFQNMESQAMPMTLPKYVKKYEKAAEQQRREELREDFCCSGRKPKLILSSPMEQQAAIVYTPTMFEIFQREFIGSLSAPFESIMRMGSIDTFKVTFIATKGQKTESMVEFNSLDSTIRCSCKMFESIGILCVHALRILNTKSQTIFEIPPRYILKRWMRSAKDGVVEDDNGEEVADNSDGPLSLCKRKLVCKALKVIDKSVAVEETLKIAEHHLDIWSKEVDDALKNGKEHLNTNYEGVSNTSCVAHVERKEKVVKILNQEETSKMRMEPQIQKKRKNEARAMNPII